MAVISARLAPNGGGSVVLTNPQLYPAASRVLGIFRVIDTTQDTVFEHETVSDSRFPANVFPATINAFGALYTFSGATVTSNAGGLGTAQIDTTGQVITTPYPVQFAIYDTTTGAIVRNGYQSVSAAQADVQQIITQRAPGVSYAASYAAGAGTASGAGAFAGSSLYGTGLAIITVPSAHNQ